MKEKIKALDPETKRLVCAFAEKIYLNNFGLENQKIKPERSPEQCLILAYNFYKSMLEFYDNNWN